MEQVQERKRDTFRRLQEIVKSSCHEKNRKKHFLAVAGENSIDQSLLLERLSAGGEDWVAELGKDHWVLVTKREVLFNFLELEQQLQKVCEEKENCLDQRCSHGIIVVPVSKTIKAEQLKELYRRLVYLHMRYSLNLIYCLENQEYCPVAEEGIVLLHDRVVQRGSMTEVYQNPKSLEIARVVGKMNVLSGAISLNNPCSWIWSNGDVRIYTPFQIQQKKVILAVRPENVRFSKEGIACKFLSMQVVENGYDYLVELADGSRIIVREKEPRNEYETRQECMSHLLFYTRRLLYFDATTGERIYRR